MEENGCLQFVTLLQHIFKLDIKIKNTTVISGFRAPKSVKHYLTQVIKKKFRNLCILYFKNINYESNI